MTTFTGAADGGDPTFTGAADGGDPTFTGAADGGDPTFTGAADGGDPWLVQPRALIVTIYGLYARDTGRLVLRGVADQAAGRARR